MVFVKKKNKIEKLKLEAEQAERAGDYGKVAEIRYGKLIEAEEQVLNRISEIKLVKYNKAVRK
ncbi:MAG: hypothetical protein U5M51_09830 [Emticicia sp.]|nr:hypothetical protein [Emticicia sp.]